MYIVQSYTHTSILHDMGMTLPIRNTAIQSRWLTYPFVQVGLHNERVGAQHVLLTDLPSWLKEEVHVNESSEDVQ